MPLQRIYVLIHRSSTFSSLELFWCCRSCCSIFLITSLLLTYHSNTLALGRSINIVHDGTATNSIILAVPYGLSLIPIYSYRFGDSRSWSSLFDPVHLIHQSRAIDCRPSLLCRSLFSYYTMCGRNLMTYLDRCSEVQTWEFS